MEKYEKIEVARGSAKTVAEAVAAALAWKPAYALAGSVMSNFLPAPVKVPAKIGMAVLQIGIAGTVTGAASEAVGATVEMPFKAAKAIQSYKDKKALQEL